MRVSNSKLRTYRRCPKRYSYKYVERLRPKARSLPLERGTWIHDLLMTHADGESVLDKHKLLTDEFYSLPEEIREELGELPEECARIFKSYVRTYKSDAQRYRTIDTELDEIVTLPNGLQLQVIVDVVVEDIIDGGIWIKDYKTRKNFEDSANMMIDPQLTLYFWAMEYMGYKPLRGGVYDEIRTKPPTIPEALKNGGLSQRKNIDTDVFTYQNEIRRCGLEVQDYADILRHIAVNQKDRFFRRTYLPQDPPVVRTTLREAVETAQEIQAAEHKHRFPRTFDKSCNWGCDYRDLCIAELYGADPESIIRLNYTRSTRGE